jgi:transposase
MGAKPTVCFNIGLTFEGLRALGAPGASLATFPIEFVEGMTSRALKLGDFGPSAPASWPATFDKPARVQMIASIYADDEKHLEGVESQVARAFTVRGVRKGRNLAADKVFFGFADNISQPRFAELRDPDTEKVDEPIDPLGTALLGYRTRNAHRLADGASRRFANDTCGRKAFVKWFAQTPVQRVVFEPTGPYHRAFERALGAAGVPFVKVNPRQARRFAEAIGKLAKTDRLQDRSPGCGDAGAHGRNVRA